MKNRVDRQIAVSLMTIAGLILVHRLLGAVRGQAFSDVASGDAFVIAAVAAVSALSIRRVYFVVALFFLVAGLVAPFLVTLAFVPLLLAAAASVAIVIASPRALQAPALDASTRGSTAPPR